MTDAVSDTKKRTPIKRLRRLLPEVYFLVGIAAAIKAGLDHRPELALSFLTLGLLNLVFAAVIDVLRDVKALQAHKSNDRLADAVLDLAEELLHDPVTQEQQRIAGRLLSAVATVAAEERS